MTAAADRAKAAEVSRLRIEGDWLVYETGEHNCGVGPDGHYGAHEPGCGLEPVMTLAELGELFDAITSTGVPINCPQEALAAARADERQRWVSAVEGLAEAVESGTFGIPPARSVIAARLRGLTTSSEEE